MGYLEPQGHGPSKQPLAGGRRSCAGPSARATAGGGWAKTPTLGSIPGPAILTVSSFKGISKSILVVVSGIEAVMELILIILKQGALYP